jgi:BirA family biotin operon repressor/biotin-[acetyl-CoA-carboxylase] ligase
VTASFGEAEARILRALADADGALPLRDLARDADAGAIEAALDALARAEFVLPPVDGVVRAGARGSALSAASVTARLTTSRLGRPVEVHAVVGSSNDLVLERAAWGASPGLVVCAELQAAGRGRRGRAFDCRPGLGIGSTTLLPSPRDAATTPRLSLIAGLAVAHAVRDVTGMTPTLKWPNDVRLKGRKLCGVLVEARSTGRSLFLVAGIGVNVHHRAEDFPGELREGAISLDAATGRRNDRSAVLAAILGQLENLLAEEDARRLDLASAFGPWDETRGRELVVENAGQRIEGAGVGVRSDGALLVAVPGRGEVAIHAGEATIRPVG